MCLLYKSANPDVSRILFRHWHGYAWFRFHVRSIFIFVNINFVKQDNKTYFLSSPLISTDIYVVTCVYCDKWQSVLSSSRKSIKILLWEIDECCVLLFFVTLYMIFFCFRWFFFLYNVKTFYQTLIIYYSTELASFDMNYISKLHVWNSLIFLD